MSFAHVLLLSVFPAPDPMVDFRDPRDCRDGTVPAKGFLFGSWSSDMHTAASTWVWRSSSGFNPVNCMDGIRIPTPGVEEYPAGKATVRDISRHRVQF